MSHVNVNERPLYYLLEGVHEIKVNGVSIYVPGHEILKLIPSSFWKYKSTAVFSGGSMDLNNEEKKMVREHQKIKAICAYRTRTGLGLKECKEMCDRYGDSVTI